MNVLFVAVDGGAREALAPVAARCASGLADTAKQAAETDACWRQVIVSERPSLLVVGTSDSTRGRLVESAARRAARGAGISIVAIEDFPGNYYEIAGGEASMVLVESTRAQSLCLEKLGNRSPRVEVVVPARYDPYRKRLAELRSRTVESWASQTTTRVLWAGQPETDDAVHTLEALLPILHEHAVDLLFKAHPRDAGYTTGTYRALLDASGIAATDVTNLSVEDALALAPRLIVTQFSSIATEAGFFGVPSLWVLLPHAGAARLRQKKGYAVPPLCLARGAAYAGDQDTLAGAFAQALADIDYRENLMRCFDDYYRVDQLGAPAVESLLFTAAGFK